MSKNNEMKFVSATFSIHRFLCIFMQAVFLLQAGRKKQYSS